MLDQVVLTREAIAAFARAVLDGAIAEDGEVHAGLMALQVCEASERLAAIVATKGLCRSSRDSNVSWVRCARRKGLGSLLGLRRVGVIKRSRRDVIGHGKLIGLVPVPSAAATATTARGAGHAGGHGDGFVDMTVVVHGGHRVRGASEGVGKGRCIGHDLGHAERTSLVEIAQVVINGGRRTIEEEVHTSRRGGVRVCIAERGLHVDDVDGRGERWIGERQRSLVKGKGQTSRRAAEGIESGVRNLPL